MLFKTKILTGPFGERKTNVYLKETEFSMPEVKLVVATCDQDNTQLECGGGYSNPSNDSVCIYFCPKCNSYYIAINGEFMGSKWNVLQPDEAVIAHFKSLTSK